MIRRKSINPSVDVFRQLPLFEGCSRRELQVLALVADEVLLPSGFVLVREGDLPRDCFLVVDGTAEAYADGHHVACLSGPAVIGAQSLRDRTRRTGSVVTTTPSRVFSFDVRGFRQLMDLPLVGERILTAPCGIAECLPLSRLVAPMRKQHTAPLMAADAHLV
jgi:CRP-like cAMP-binding protein